MTKKQYKLAEKYGWLIDCESPFEMSHEDGSRATGVAAQWVMAQLENQEKASARPAHWQKENPADQLLTFGEKMRALIEDWKSKAIDRYDFLNGLDAIANDISQISFYVRGDKDW